MRQQSCVRTPLGVAVARSEVSRAHLSWGTDVLESRRMLKDVAAPEEANVRRNPNDLQRVLGGAYSTASASGSDFSRPRPVGRAAEEWKLQDGCLDSRKDGGIA